MSKLAVAVLVLSLGVTAAQNANPKCGQWPDSIKPEFTPGLVGQETSFETKVMNDGPDGATDVDFTLSYNDWGITANGWQPIDTYTVDLPAGGDYVHQFMHTFENRGHVCLQLTIDSVGAGGNTITTDDRTQINWDVAGTAEEQLSWGIPFGNGDGEEILVDGIRVVCLKDGVEVPCPLPGDGHQGGDRVLPVVNGPDGAPLQPFNLGRNEEVLAELVVPFVPDEGMTVFVEASMGGELNHVVVEIHKTTVEEVLNHPWLCCIKSIKTRVLLETMLADALDAYENKDCTLALKLLRMFMQKAILLECDLDKEEKACIEKALLQMVDVARMISIEFGATKDIIAEGDFFRRAGLYEAAVLEYSKAC